MEAEGDRITLADLMADPELLGHLPQGYKKELFRHQLEDPGLCGQKLDDLMSIGPDVLVDQLLKQGLEWEQQAEIPEEEAEETEGDDLPIPDNRISIIITKRGIEAKVVLHKPGEGQDPLTEEDVHKVLTSYGIHSFVKDEYIRRLVEVPVYERKFKVALGKAPVDGEDGKVIFHFNPDFDLSPRIDEDGVADYKSLDYAQNVKKGDLLCEILPPRPGVDGASVSGEVIPARAGRIQNVVCGLNTVLSNDRTKIYADCDGQVFYKNNQVKVSKVMILDDVDASTGNIFFIGSIQIKGDVREGFTVRAGGDITVGGIVESAAIHAGGNVILKNGMNGRDTGVLEAGGSIRAFFLERVRIVAKGDIFVNEILNCRIECWGDMNIRGRKGCLIGGSCTVGGVIDAAEIGNYAHTYTDICMKSLTPVAELRRRNALKTAEYKKMSEKISLILSTDMQLDSVSYQILLCRLVCVRKMIEHRIEECQKLDHKIKQQEDTQHIVRVRGSIYPNVVIEIDGLVFKNADQKDSSSIQVIRGKMIRKALY